MSVDPIYAQWLQAAALFHVEEDAVLGGRWGDSALICQRTTSIASKADAAAEALRQLDFLGGPLVIDEHEVPSSWASRIGQVVTLTIGELGYDGGVDVFVIGAADDLATGLSTVTVIRRL